MTPRPLAVLAVPPRHPASILSSLEAAIAGTASYVLVPGGELPADRRRRDLLARTQRVGEDVDPRVAVVVATSGSTGTPKGAMLTPANLVASADATHRALGGEGHWLLAMPAHHIAGLQVLVRSLVAGVDPYCLDLTRGFSVDAFARGAAELARTGERRYTALTPMQLMKAMDHLVGIEALQSFHAILVGGAPLSREAARAAASLNIRVVCTYGSSETAGGCVYDGRPLPGTRVRIEGPEHRILLGGPTVALGYRNAPEHEAFSTPGWFRTSDAGYVDPDTTLLSVRGRLDAVIDTGGLKLHPEVLERELTDAPGVDSACVVGVPHPRLGQAVVAAYCGAAAPDAVYEHLAELPRWQWPKELRRVADLPRTALGKVNRQAVAELFAATGR